MGLADWSAVGRYAGTVSALSDVSSVVFEVEQGRADEEAADNCRSQVARGGGVDDSESYIDGSYAAAKKGGSCVGKSRAGNATKIMALADSAGLPIAVTVAEGSRHDVSLVDQTLEEAVVRHLPRRLIGDKAFDSAQLAVSLRDERDVEWIAPKRKGSRRRQQDGRAMRRYKRRWKVERLFGWIKRFRRVATRWDTISDNYLGFVQLAAAVIVLKRI